MTVKMDMKQKMAMEKYKVGWNNVKIRGVL
jgi:hypothetical protein